MNKQNIFFISELKHVEEVDSFLAAHPDIREEGYFLIPIDAEIEYVLTKKGIPFKSGRNYRTENTASMTLGEAWAAAIFESERWSFFTYRGVSLSRLYFLSLQEYVTQLIYYADIVSNVFLQHASASRYVVFSTNDQRPVSARVLAVHQMNVLADIVMEVARQNGKEVFVQKMFSSTSTRTHIDFFALKRRAFGWGIAALNLFVTLVRRPRRIRILASDYWGNMAPYLRNLDSVEVTLIDRKEAFNAGLSNILHFRMKFLHLDAFSQKNSLERQNARTFFENKWRSIQAHSDVPGCVFRGFSMQSLLIHALDTIIGEVSDKVLKDIDDSHVLLAHLKPDVVILRATISGQTHFGILAQVARSLGIPSVDMQQGIEYYGPGSMSKRHSAEYMGVYGPLTQKELKEVGDTITPVIIGSPRFDVYASLLEAHRAKQPMSHTGFSILCIAPPILLGIAADTYEIEEYFSAVATAVLKIPNVSVTIKLRPGPSREPFYRSAIAFTFAGIPHTVAQFEPLGDLYLNADVVVSCYSTTALEALQCGKPLVYLGLSPIQRMMAEYQFGPYTSADVIRIAYTQQELTNVLADVARDPSLRQKMSYNAEEFCKREYAFDGRASERIAAFILSLVSNKR